MSTAFQPRPAGRGAIQKRSGTRTTRPNEAAHSRRRCRRTRQERSLVTAASVDASDCGTGSTLAAVASGVSAPTNSGRSVGRSVSRSVEASIFGSPIAAFFRTHGRSSVSFSSKASRARGLGRLLSANTECPLVSWSSHESQEDIDRFWPLRLPQREGHHLASIAVLPVERERCHVVEVRVRVRLTRSRPHRPTFISFVGEVAERLDQRRHGCALCRRVCQHMSNYPLHPRRPRLPHVMRRPSSPRRRTP
jgi:hypothetical protein